MPVPLNFPSTDLNIIVSIGRLIDSDAIATIDNKTQTTSPNSANPNSLTQGTSPNDLGIYLDLLQGELTNSILNQSTTSNIVLTLNSNVNSSILQSNSQVGPNATGSTSSSLLVTLTTFLNTLNGRPITCYVTHYNYTTNASTYKVIYQGFIETTPSTIEVKGGTQIRLTCRTLLGQLEIMSGNGSWQDSSKTYGSIFTTVSANTVGYKALFTDLFKNTLCQNSPLVFTDGNAKPVPDNVWAVIVPNKPRLSVIKEILLPYSRLIYQYEDGTINVRPLFIDNYAASQFNIDAYNNINNNFISLVGTNKAAVLPNRIDVMFGAAIPVSGYGLINNYNIFASAPYIDPISDTIEPNDDGSLSYAQVYATSTRLYNSGKFVMPRQETLPVDNSLLTNASLLNGITTLYNSDDLSNSSVYYSADVSKNTIPILYSQIFLALSNTENYNATIEYDYLQVVDLPNPLGQIISITNYGIIDYPQMIVTNTMLTFDVDRGCRFFVDTAPLFSITGVWYKEQADA